MTKQSYDYIKDKYKSYTFKLDRVADHDLIQLLNEWPTGPTACFRQALRWLLDELRAEFKGVRRP